MAASVVVFPEPVAPVTRMSPRCSSASFCTPSGRLSCSKLGTVFGMTRNANEIERRVIAEGLEIAVASKDRRLADLQVDVTGAELDGAPEQTVQIHKDSNEG